MSIKQLVGEWDQQGRFDQIRAEFTEYAAALRVPAETNIDRKFSTDQIRYCFQTLLAPIAVKIAVERDDIQVSVQRIADKFREEMSLGNFPETLWMIASYQHATEREMFDTLVRNVRILKWRNEADDAEN